MEASKQPAEVRGGVSICYGGEGVVDSLEDQVVCFLS